MRSLSRLGVALGLLFLPISAAFAGTITGKITVKGVRDARDAVVYVDAIPGKAFVAPQEHAKMDQKNMVFIPHVVPVLAGTTVDFLNTDDVLHNVFTPDKCADKFNLGTWPKGQTRSYVFKQAGCEAVMLCNVHPEMEAFVVVLSTPYFGETDAAGAYTIEGVPAGEYTLKVWHAKLKKAEPEMLEIAVPAEGKTEANFSLKRQ